LLNGSFDISTTLFIKGNFHQSVIPVIADATFLNRMLGNGFEETAIGQDLQAIALPSLSLFIGITIASSLLMFIGNQLAIPSPQSIDSTPQSQMFIAEKEILPVSLLLAFEFSV
jgi:hypothetical protein